MEMVKKQEQRNEMTITRIMVMDVLQTARQSKLAGYALVGQPLPETLEPTVHRVGIKMTLLIQKCA